MLVMMTTTVTMTTTINESQRKVGENFGEKKKRKKNEKNVCNKV